jgi:flagellar basal-body rod modification protein FlgD
MAVDSVTVTSSVGSDGNSFTTSVSNDELTNEDFLNLMIQELKLQDPTSPMDSSQMLSTQMQMSTIQTNQELAAAMTTMQASFSQTALATAANVIGQNVEDGNISDTGINKAYTVRSIENNDGEVIAKVQEILYLEQQVKVSDEDGNDTIVNYNSAGEVLDDSGVATGEKIVLSDVGSPFVDADGNLLILDADNEEVSSHSYSLTGGLATVYSDELTSLPFDSITKIF